MYARSVTIPLGVLACTVRPSAPRAGIRHRCVVFQDVVCDAATIERTRRDATGRWSRAGPASARPATEATHVAGSARPDGLPDESADSNERGHPTGATGRGLRAEGLAVSTTRSGSLRWSARCDASRVEWRAASPPSTEFCLDVILARHRICHAAGRRDRIARMSIGLDQEYFDRFNIAYATVSRRMMNPGRVSRARRAVASCW